MIFTEQINNIKNLDKTEMEKAMLRWDEIAKPVGSLGFLRI